MIRVGDIVTASPAVTPVFRDVLWLALPWQLEYSSVARFKHDDTLEEAQAAV
jgi:hypothetical protein